MSYTTFKYGGLTVKPITTTVGNEVGRRFEVAFTVTNTGKREGADVAQVYVGDTHSSVPRPAKELKGFVKVSLRPGETKSVSVVLDNRSLSYFDVANKQWRADAGDFDVLVGRSSQQIELRGKLTLSAPLASPK